MTSTARDRIVAVALIGMGAAAIASGMAMTQGAGVFPIATGALVILSSAFQLLTAHRISESEGEPEAVSWTRFAVAAALAVVFYFLIEPLGTFIAIPLYMIAAILTLSHLRPVQAIVIAVGFSAAIFVVFEYLLEIPTPPGLLDFLLDR